MMLPYYPWQVPVAPNYCDATKETPEKDILIRAKKSYIKNCGDKYPQAMAMKLFDEGGTWKSKKL